MNDSDQSASESTGQPTEQSATSISHSGSPTHHRLRTWMRRHWKWLTLVSVLVVGGGSIYAWTILRATPVPKSVAVNKATPKPTPTPPIKKASPLTGVMVDPAAADRSVMSVVVENHPDARPQSGLGEAGVVYEALAEGGITRFQAFFLENRPTSIGPVRSLRPYFVDWGLEFGAPIAHAGGSAEAIGSIGSLGVKSLNALSVGAPTFYRTKDRAAPHNLYTSGGLLDQLLAARGYNQPATFTPSLRKADTPSSAAPHPNIAINYSYNGFQSGYQYNAATNDYARTMTGIAHVDRATGQQIRVKNVVVEYMPTTTQADGHVRMQTVGRGQGVLFRDGEAIACTWAKDARTTRTKLLDANGVEIPLNAGNTWYSIVPVGKTVSY